MALGEVAQQADDDPRRVRRRRTLDRYQSSFLVEVVLDERAGGLSGRETVRIKLNGKARPGKANLKLTFTDGAGASDVVKKKLRIPR